MVGLTILLDSHKKSFNKSPQIINKTTIIKPPPPPPPPPPTPYSSSSSSCWYSSSPLPSISFLEECFLCKQRLLPGKDIYMYNGDRAFCSVDCRCRQIFMDEENIKRENCSVAAMKVKSTSSTSSSSRHQRKGNKNRAGDFAY